MLIPNVLSCYIFCVIPIVWEIVLDVPKYVTSDRW